MEGCGNAWFAEVDGGTARRSDGMIVYLNLELKKLVEQA
jgi:hypothetical protein